MEGADRFVRLRLLTGRHFTPASLVFAGTFIREKTYKNFRRLSIVRCYFLFRFFLPLGGLFTGHDSVDLLPKILMNLFPIPKSFVCFSVFSVLLFVCLFLATSEKSASSYWKARSKM